MVPFQGAIVKDARESVANGDRNTQRARQADHNGMGATGTDFSFELLLY